MKEPNDEIGTAVILKWYHSLIFVALGLVGYASYVWWRGNYFDALTLPLIVGFVWLAGMKQKLAWAVALVAFFVIFAVPAMAAGFMSWYLLTPLLSSIALMVVSIAMFKLPPYKSLVMVVVVLLGLLLLLAFDFVDRTTVAYLTVGLGAGLLYLYFFPELRESASKQ